MTIILATLFMVSISILLLLLLPRRLKTSPSSPQLTSRQPPGPRKLPVIGNLHQLAGWPLPHHRLRDLAREYGPLMQLQLGQIPALIVTSPDWAKQFLQAHDANFANRPISPAATIIFYRGRDIGFAPYGDYWRKMRKICAVELLSARRVRTFRPTMERQVSKMTESISRRSPSAVNLSEAVVSLGNAVTSRVAFGKTGEREEALLVPYIEQIMTTLGGFSLVDLFPSSKLLRFVTGTEAKLRKLHKSADAILETIISDHVAKRSSLAKHDDDDDHGEEDLVDVLLNLKEENKDAGFHFSNVEIKAIILDIFLAGTETWAITVDWAMAELVKNPRVMEKVQKEVREVFGAKGKIEDEALIDELPYLQLVIKETLRLHPPGPLLLPRENRETTVVNGYEIPAKTTVFVNVWANARDPDHWTDPETFWPERFLINTCVDYKGVDFQLTPFGAGRRICPGINYGIAIVNLVLANLLYSFDWVLPDGMKPEDFDMSERFGVEVRRKNDLFLIPVPRTPLSSSLA